MEKKRSGVMEAMRNVSAHVRIKSLTIVSYANQVIGNVFHIVIAQEEKFGMKSLRNVFQLTDVMVNLKN